MNNICVFCLSKDRKLSLINGKQWHTVNAFLNVDVGVDMALKNLYTENLLKICWECHRRINNFNFFTECVRESCKSLTGYIGHALAGHKKIRDSISKMGVTKVEIISIMENYAQENHVNPTVNIVPFSRFMKTSLIKIKDKEFSTEHKQLSDKLNKANTTLCNIDDSRTKQPDSDSDNEPLANRFSLAYKKKLEGKISQSKSQFCMRNANTKLLPKYTVCWASKSQAQKWYQEECTAERLANPNFKWLCDACRRVFPDIDMLTTHVKQSHDEKVGQYNCHLCLHRFINVNILKEHVENHYFHYKCNECGHVSRNLFLIQTHIDKQHFSGEINKGNNMKTEKCKKCKNDFPAGVVISKHRKECQLYKCNLCEKSYTDLSSYKHHLKSHNSTTAEAYTYCEGCKSYIKNTWYKKHFLTSLKHVSRDTFKFPCSVCSVKMPTSYTLKLHMFKVHLKRGVHQCELCPSYYMNRRRLDRHRATNHQLGTFELKRDKICEMCGKGFTSHKVLEDHVRTHTGERPHRCGLCPATFAQHGNLYRHCLVVHRKRIRNTGTAEADKECCDVCGKEFRTKFLLKAHYDFFHLKKTKHRCDICDKYFISTITLRDHNECLHGLVSLKKSCATCGKLFKTAYSLNLHSKFDCSSSENPTTTPAAEYNKCRECGNTYQRASTLYMHYKMKHLKLKRNDRVAIKNLYNPDKEIVVIRDPVKSKVSGRSDADNVT